MDETKNLKLKFSLRNAQSWKQPGERRHAVLIQGILTTTRVQRIKEQLFPGKNSHSTDSSFLDTYLQKYGKVYFCYVYPFKFLVIHYCQQPQTTHAIVSCIQKKMAQTWAIEYSDCKLWCFKCDTTMKYNDLTKVN